MGSVEDWNGFIQQRCKVKLSLKAAENYSYGTHRSEQSV